MLPKTRKKLPSEQRRITNAEYAFAIEVALKQEFGNSRHAVKVLVRLTGASERTAQNWLSGVRGPSGLHLILLVQHVASVRSTIMVLAGQGDQRTVRVDAALALLNQAAAILLAEMQ